MQNIHGPGETSAITANTVVRFKQQKWEWYKALGVPLKPLSSAQVQLVQISPSIPPSFNGDTFFSYLKYVFLFIYLLKGLVVGQRLFI